MKKWLLAMLLVLAMAIPALAQDFAEDKDLKSVEAGAAAYKGFYLFLGFTSPGVQWDTTVSPVSTVSAGSTLYGHVQWEMNETVGNRKYVLRVFNSNGVMVYKSPPTSYTGNAPGQYWQAISIPTASLSPGYYTMQMTVTLILPAGDVVKSVSSKFRVT